MPKILKRKNSEKAIKNSKLNQKEEAWDKLHSLGHHRKSRQEKTNDQIEFEKNPEEFTFKPKFYVKFPRHSISPSPSSKERLNEVLRETHRSSFNEK